MIARSLNALSTSRIPTAWSGVCNGTMPQRRNTTGSSPSLAGSHTSSSVSEKAGSPVHRQRAIIGPIGDGP